MDWFQFLAFFLAMLVVGGFFADNFLEEVIDIIAEKKGE